MKVEVRKKEQNLENLSKVGRNRGIRETERGGRGRKSGRGSGAGSEEGK